MSTSTTPQRTYQAFISYRHADNTIEGRQWATWLHQAIETYQVPDELVGKKNSRGEDIPERIFPIFRDEDELPADADLGNSIANALKASRLLVVVCSPNAVASTYVADEIDYFKRLGHSDRIIAMIIDGEPNVSWDTSKHKLGFSAEQECFPLPLQFRYDDNGQRTEQRAEPIAADFRVFHDGKPQQSWTSQAAYRNQLKQEGRLTPQDIDNAVKRYGDQQNLMLLKIIAGILGVPLGELTQRDKVYQLALAKQRAKRLRQWLTAVAGLACLAIGAGIWAYTQQQIAEQQRDTALISQSRFLLNQAELRAEEGHFDDAILLGLNALPGLYGGNRPWVNELAGIRMGMQQNNKLLSWRAPQTVDHAQLIPNSKYLAVSYDDGRVDVVDTTSGQVVAQLNHEARIDGFTVSPKGQFIALKGRDSRLTLWSLSTFEKINDIAMRGWSESVQFNADESIVFSLNYPGFIAKYPISDATAMFETEVIESANRLIISPNDNYLATADLFGMDAHVFDAQTGQLLRAIPSEEGVYSGAMREPRFNPLNNDILLVYSNLGTHSYSVISDESGLAAGYHMIFNPQGEKALMLSTGQRVESGNQEADALNSLASSPVVIDINTRNYVPLDHGLAPAFIQFGADGLIYSGAGDDINVWDHTTGQRSFSFKAPNSDNIDIDNKQQRLLTWQRGAQQIELYKLRPNHANVVIPSHYRALGRSLSASAGFLMVVSEDSKHLAWLNTQSNTIEGVAELPCERLWRDAQVIYSATESMVAIHCERQSWFTLSRASGQVNTFSASTVAAASGLAAEVITNNQGVIARVFQWETNTTVAELVLPIDSRYDIEALNISPDGEYLTATLSGDKTLVINIATHAIEHHIPIAGEAMWLAAPRLALVKEAYALTFWQAEQTEPVWRFADGRQYSTMIPIANGNEVLVQTTSDELLWLDVVNKQVKTIITLNGYDPAVREYPQYDMMIILGYQWQSWRLSDNTLVDRSREFSQTKDIAFDAASQQLVKITDETSYSRYPAWLDITVEQARQFLPVGRNCLTTAQRARYYLPELTIEQRQQRGCD